LITPIALQPFLSLWRRWLVPICAAVALVFLLKAIWIACHWPFVHDAPIMHYVVFLMSHGFAPYRDIIDMQMPGTYLSDALVIRILGPGIGGEISWDILNGLVVIAAAMWIAGKGRRTAAVLAGSLSYLMHLRDGAWCLGERDWTVSMLLLLSVACLIQFLREYQAIWIGWSFVCAGLASSIKPPAMLLTVACVVVVLLKTRRCSPFTGKIVLWSTAGLMVPTVIFAVYLFKFHVLHDFVVTTTGLIPYYASLQRQSLPMLLGLIHQPIRLGEIALFVFLLNKSWRSTASLVLLTATVCGFAIYILQGKGFAYHMYPVITFVVLWMILEVEKSLRQNSPWTLASGGLLLFVVMRLSIISLSQERSTLYPMGTYNSLERDLAALDVPDLSGHIQCLDMTTGSCINTLYRLKLVQSTGYISDFYLFANKPTPLTNQYQQRFYQLITANPPRIFVLSSHTWPGDTQSYAQLSNYSTLKNFIENDYFVAKEYDGKNGGLSSYRIYVRK
jgi:hypothetical protein